MTVTEAVTEAVAVAVTVWDRACDTDPSSHTTPPPTKGPGCAPTGYKGFAPTRSGFDCSIVLCCIFGCFGHNIVNIAP